MPRGDGTGPWGTGRGGCQPMSFFNSFGAGFCRGGFGRGSRQNAIQGEFGFANSTPAVPTVSETLEVQAKRLEVQAKLLVSQANTLRSLANQNYKAE
ncbi:DUF5320 domain-containing protein [Sporomusa acidovorans]|uniref:DUF5320 domain-containing protein n=1 Tax=Sporomusa acidovorans (strain ATCC 49682 / DSM 3132 / Mol) TaxID=1123286 RepID=A0ABZ3J0Z5_SPOA4|nr:DUF5320 domain-containing protein [Sporomusa acidovorans]OZC17323.1 hypothetical protein SPACI_38580 [Sporomusa acidovorans DSM 3132]SDF84933.1 hypothetical protein SAMN04488499_11012 [Sporomusa acidovorans]